MYMHKLILRNVQHPILLQDQVAQVWICIFGVKFAAPVTVVRMCMMCKMMIYQAGLNLSFLEQQNLRKLLVSI